MKILMTFFLLLYLFNYLVRITLQSKKKNIIAQDLQYQIDVLNDYGFV